MIIARVESVEGRKENSWVEEWCHVAACPGFSRKPPRILERKAPGPVQPHEAFDRHESPPKERIGIAQMQCLKILSGKGGLVLAAAFIG